MTPISANLNSSYIPEFNNSSSDSPNISALKPETSEINQAEVNPTEKSSPSQKTADSFELTYKNTATKVSQTVTTYIEQQLNKQTVGVDANLSWPIKSLWGKVTSFFNRETPPLLEVRTEIQKAIEGNSKNSDWFQKTLQEMKESTDKLKGNEENKEVLLEIYKKHKQIEILANCPLPNNELPLFYAARLNNYEAMQTLLRIGASPFQKDGRGVNVLRKDVYGQTLFDYATLNDNPQIKALILDFFEKLSYKLMEATLQSAVAEKIPLNEQFCEFAEQNVYRRVNELLEETAKKQMIADPLASTMQQWLQAGMLASLATTWTISKVLNSYESTANGTLADHAENMTQMIATLGSYLQMIELSSNFITFTNGFLQSKTPIIPLLSHVGLQVLASLYAPFARLNTIINTTIVASTVIDTSYVCYQNRKQRPLAAATKAIVTGLNLTARYMDIFEIFKQTVIDTPLTATDTQRKIVQAMNNKTLEIYSDYEDEALVSRLIIDPKRCNQAYKRLSVKWHPDKHLGNQEFYTAAFASIVEGMENYCNSKKTTEVI